MKPSFSMRFYFLRASNFSIIYIYKDYFFLHIQSLELRRPLSPCRVSFPFT
jgi:hypothetical protein